MHNISEESYVSKYIISPTLESSSHFSRVTDAAAAQQTWPYRRWTDQARCLYPDDPTQQQRAILEHIQLAQHCIMNVERWLWLAAIGAHLVENAEVVR